MLVDLRKKNSVHVELSPPISWVSRDLFVLVTGLGHRVISKRKKGHNSKVLVGNQKKSANYLTVLKKKEKTQTYNISIKIRKSWNYIFKPTNFCECTHRNVDFGGWNRVQNRRQTGNSGPKFGTWTEIQSKGEESAAAAVVNPSLLESTKT